MILKRIKSKIIWRKNQFHIRPPRICVWYRDWPGAAYSQAVCMDGCSFIPQAQESCLVSSRKAEKPYLRYDREDAFKRLKTSLTKSSFGNCICLIIPDGSTTMPNRHLRISVAKTWVNPFLAKPISASLITKLCWWHHVHPVSAVIVWFRHLLFFTWTLAKVLHGRLPSFAVLFSPIHYLKNIKIYFKKHKYGCLLPCLKKQVI